VGESATMFSVVIPIYNHAKYVKQAIWSALRSPLVQEVLLLDDGSNDGSARIAASMAAEHPVRVRNMTPVPAGNRGAHHRLNELIDLAECEWIAILNSDDAFVSGRFEAIVRHPEFSACDFAFGNVLFMDERGKLMGAQRGPFDSPTPFRPSRELLRMVAERSFLPLLYEQNYLITSSNMIFRKSLHTQIGGFRPYRYVHDWDFALRALVRGRAAYVQHFLTAYRIHPNNTILDNELTSSNEIRSMLDRFESEFGREGNAIV
jgi:glycosyltransferase involved in cell wall biosynthesis